MADRGGKGMWHQLHIFEGWRPSDWRSIPFPRVDALQRGWHGQCNDASGCVFTVTRVSTWMCQRSTCEHVRRSCVKQGWYIWKKRKGCVTLEPNKLSVFIENRKSQTSDCLVFRLEEFCARPDRLWFKSYKPFETDKERNCDNSTNSLRLSVIKMKLQQILKNKKCDTILFIKLFGPHVITQACQSLPWT